MSTKLEKELERAVTRRDELSDDLKAVRELLSTKRGEMASMVYEQRGSPDKLLSEIQKIEEKETVINVALQKAETVFSELSDELAKNQKSAALKEIARLNAIGEKHVVMFINGLRQAKREGQLAKDTFREMYEIQHKNDLLSEEYRLKELITWVNCDELQLGILLTRFDTKHPEMSKDAQR